MRVSQERHHHENPVDEAEAIRMANEAAVRQQATTDAGRVAVEGLDEILDDIDEALAEIDAQAFVSQYVQANGE